MCYRVKLCLGGPTFPEFLGGPNVPEFLEGPNFPDILGGPNFFENLMFKKNVKKCQEKCQNDKSKVVRKKKKEEEEIGFIEVLFRT